MCVKYLVEKMKIYYVTPLLKQGINIKTTLPIYIDLETRHRIY